MTSVDALMKLAGWGGSIQSLFSRDLLEVLGLFMVSLIKVVLDMFRCMYDHINVRNPGVNNSRTLL